MSKNQRIVTVDAPTAPWLTGVAAEALLRIILHASGKPDVDNDAEAADSPSSRHGRSCGNRDAEDL